MAKPTPPSKQPDALVPIRWVGDTELPLTLADQIHVRHVPGRFYLTFGQLNLPVFDGPPPEGLVAEIKAVTRLVVTDTDIERMIEAMRYVSENAKKERPAP